MKQNLTILIAHPDDEFLFAWPVIREARRIIACVDDKTHKTRQWCRRRSEAFHEIGKLVGAETICLRHDSGFVKKEHNELLRFVSEVRDLIPQDESIFTHNGWGEYGHTDHMFLNQLVKMTGNRMLTTDICLRADWYEIRPYFQGSPLSQHKNDLEFHNKCMSIYRSYNAMGWQCPPIMDCNLIEVTR